MRLFGFLHYGGVLADRKDRSQIIYFFQGIQMPCPVLIVVLVATEWDRRVFHRRVTDALHASVFISDSADCRQYRSETCARVELDSVQFIPRDGAG
jgi:hypothetical protein